MRVIVNLDGPSEVISPILAMALEAGILHAMQMKDDTEGLPELSPRAGQSLSLTPKQDLRKQFVYGTAVRVKYSRSDRPESSVYLGELGLVQKTKMSGRGLLVTVKMNTDKEEISLPSSMLEIIK